MIQKTVSLLRQCHDAPLFLIRLVLAYGFFNPAITKAQDIHSVADWFESLHIPLPLFNAYLSTGTELLGVVLLSTGLFTRFIAIPLMITMLVAIKTVHGANGFEAANNGFEIPLYYLLMLLSLMVFGAGRLSLDHLIFKGKI